MKKTIITILIILSNNVIYSQDKKDTIETGIRIQRTEFIPYEYTRELSDTSILSNEYPLKKNIKTINPLFLHYKNLDKGFGLEFEYSKIQIERSNYFSTFYFRDGIQFNKLYLRNNERSDFKLNLFFYLTEELKDYLALGIGIRRIDRIRNIDEGSFLAEEKIVAHGPQLILRSKLPITDKISFNFGFDLYHTQGKRNYSYMDTNVNFARSGLYSNLTTISENGKTIGIFRGVETFAEIKYNFLENFNLAIGYNYNYSYFKYENLGDKYFSYSSLNNSVLYYDSKLSNGKEIIKGFYISGSTIF